MADNADDTRPKIDANEAGLKATEGTDNTRTESWHTTDALPPGPYPGGSEPRSRLATTGAGAGRWSPTQAFQISRTPEETTHSSKSNARRYPMRK